MFKLNAAARIKQIRATTEVSADANEFVRLTDALSGIIGPPQRRPGNYSYHADIGGREFDVIIEDKGRAMHVAVEKDGKAKYEADVNTAEVGIRAVEEGVKVYIKHEVRDAKAAKQFLSRFSKRPIILTEE